MDSQFEIVEGSNESLKGIVGVSLVYDDSNDQIIIQGGIFPKNDFNSNLWTFNITTN